MIKCGALIASGSKNGSSFCLNPVPERVCIAKFSKGVYLNTWHCRLGHAFYDGIQEMLHNGVVRDLEITCSVLKKRCSSSASAKQSRTLVPKFSTHKTKTFPEPVQSDVCGSFKTKFKWETLCFVTLLDDFPRWTTVYQIWEKSEVLNKLKTFLIFAERQTGKQLK